MKRKLLVLNALLAGLAILAASELWRQKVEADRRFAILESLSDPRQPPELPEPAAAPKIRQSAYMPIVDRLLFSRDRNATVVVEVAEPPPEPERPPLPVLIGLVDFGDGPSALMSPDPKTEPDWVSVGGKVGEYVLQGVEGDTFLLAWNGEEVKVSRDRLENGGEGVRAASKKSAGRTAASQAPPVPAATAVPERRPQNIGGDHNIGKELRPGVYAADPKDPAPDGTVFKDYVKRVRKTPFGSQSWWEKK